MGARLEINQLITALQAQGIQLILDHDTGFKIQINPGYLGRSIETGMVLLQLLKQYQSQVLTFLHSMGG